MAGEVEVKKAFCRWCNAQCRLRVLVKDNHLVDAEEDPDNPRPVWPPVKACVRRMMAKEYMYHPDRVNYPLKRAGEKGEGKWQQISWEQAFDEIAEKLSRLREDYGAETLACSSGTARDIYEFRSRFLNLFGTPNQCGQASICYGPKHTILKATRGWASLWNFGLEKTKCFLLVGRAPENSWASLWYLQRGVRKKGGRLIVIDPRYTESAQEADLWLQIRPGTDAALALGLLNVIINEELYDKEFVANWCYGFEQLSERVQQYPPEKVAEITEIPADKIREAARMWATTKPAVVTWGMGVEHLENNAEAMHAFFSMEAICGNVNVEGGQVLTGPHPTAIMDHVIELSDMLPPEQRKKQLGSDRFRVFTFPGWDMRQEYIKKVWGQRGDNYKDTCLAPAPLVYRAMLTGEPYPIKAMITLSSNPMMTQPNTKLVYKALKKLELYVVVDFWMTPSAELADYVLPSACWLERPELWTGFGNSNFLYGAERALPRSIPGEYDHRTDFEIWRELGIRLGQKDYWPWKTEEECYDERVKPAGYASFAEFISKGGKDYPPIDYDIHKKIGFATPTGKIELYSTEFEKLGYDPLPSYREPPETPRSQPELAKEYPLTLITGARFRPFYHSEHRQIESLRRRYPNPKVQIHPETAEKLGISNGDWVWIETRIGRCRQKCEYFTGIKPNTISAQHGWWFPELPGEEPWLHGVWESNIEVCLGDDPDTFNPMLGSWPLRPFLCKVYKCKEYPR